jgi:hypothetical protein
MVIQKKMSGFTLNIGVPDHDVNSDTFLTSLTCITEIIGIVNSGISPDRKIEIRVKALQAGSFECSCFVQGVLENATALLPIFSAMDLKYFRDLIAIVVDFFRIKQFLKGSNPVSVEEIENKTKVQLTDSRGNIIIVNNNAYHYHNSNQEANDAVSRNFEKLNSDTNVNAFGIIPEEGVAFKACRKEFPALQQKVIVDDKKSKEVIFEDQPLYIFKIVWDSSNKWCFIWHGIKIHAHIKDASFFKKIDSGEQFAKGDTIIADIKAFQIYKDASWINDSYEIVSIKKHIPRMSQVSFNIEN